MSAGSLPYESRLNADGLWALQEGSKHFEKNGAVQNALKKITRRLEELGIPYAVVGGMALFLHGFRRFTEDVGLLVTTEGLKTIHEKLDGLGWYPPFRGSKHLRDAEYGVKIEFLTTGGFPGNGKPKAVSFPDPDQVAVDLNGFKVLQLSTLIELKLASGTAAHRVKDLGDVQELIRVLKLPRDMALQFDPSVRDKYLELWDGVAQAGDEP